MLWKLYHPAKSLFLFMTCNVNRRKCLTSIHFDQMAEAYNSTIFYVSQNKVIFPFLSNIQQSFLGRMWNDSNKFWNKFCWSCTAPSFIFEKLWIVLVVLPLSYRAFGLNNSNVPISSIHMRTILPTTDLSMKYFQLSSILKIVNIDIDRHVILETQVFSLKQTYFLDLF